ncbi:hypothetical protein [Actinotalea solisilvae]|uniref:hypothetical protein n=1 Tax=Actinotalea solisilvae TaxID=2072922 RepID=UPI0018F1F9D3|nr:hypothetical protein [Actinotalea solisilvae]
MDPYRSPENVARAAAAVRAAHEALIGREHDGVRVDSVWHYGAVDLHTAHLVVWIMLGGRPLEELPEWFTIGPDPSDPAKARAVDPAWLHSLRQVVVDAFAAQGWPEPDRVHVLTDSSDRAASQGGWFYFK